MEEKEKFNQSKYVADWTKKHSKLYQLKFDKKKDKDVIKRLEQQDNKTDYIRKLIKQDIIDNKY